MCLSIIPGSMQPASRFLRNRNPPAWLERDFILGYFGKKPSTAQKNYREFIEARLDKKYKSPLEEVMGSTILAVSILSKKSKKDSLREKKLIETCRL